MNDDELLNHPDFKRNPDDFNDRFRVRKIMESIDPTAIPIQFDPTLQRMIGRAYHGNTYFDVPFISEILPGLWQGGCEQGLILPAHIDYVVSLYPWEKYTIRHDAERHEVTMYDSVDMEHPDLLNEVADRVNAYRKAGTVLVHCQAGLNRSSLIAGLALIRNGDVKDGKEAIELLRSKRSPACLCNPAFHDYLMER